MGRDAIDRYELERAANNFRQVVQEYLRHRECDRLSKYPKGY